MGGAVDAIEAQYMQQEIEQAAYAYAKAIDDGEKVVVGVNKFVDEHERADRGLPHRRGAPALPGGPGRQRVRAERDQAAVDAALADVEAAARGTQNLLVPMKVALGHGHPGEVSDVLARRVGFRPGAEAGRRASGVSSPVASTVGTGRRSGAAAGATPRSGRSRGPRVRPRGCPVHGSTSGWAADAPAQAQ